MDRKRLLRNPLLWILAVVLLYLAFSTIFDSNRGFTQVSTTKAIAQINSGNVEKATLETRNSSSSWSSRTRRRRTTRSS